MSDRYKLKQVKVIYSGVGQLLKGSEVSGYLSTLASSICPDTAGYATDLHKASTRYVASVYTETAAAAKDNSENNTLLKALG